MAPRIVVPLRAPAPAPARRPPRRRRPRPGAGRAPRPRPRRRLPPEREPARRGGARRGRGRRPRRPARPRLLERPDVDYVSVKVSALVAQLVDVGHRGHRGPGASSGCARCTAAARRRPGVFVNLDMEEYRDLDLTIEVFTAPARRARVPRARGRDRAAGLPARRRWRRSTRLTAFADAAGRGGGGAGIKVRLVKGANLAMEQVDAELHGWAQAPYAHQGRGRRELPAPASTGRSAPSSPARCASGVACHNLYDVALAHLLAERRGVSAALDVEMLQGMAPAQARAVTAATSGRSLLYTPVVRAGGLRRRGRLPRAPARGERRSRRTSCTRCSPTRARASTGEPAFAGTMADQEARFRASVDGDGDDVAAPSRTADRPPAGPTFANTTDSDPALPPVRRWAAERVAAVRSGASVAGARRPSPTSTRVVAAGRAAQPRWAARPGGRAGRDPARVPPTSSRPAAASWSR